MAGQRFGHFDGREYWHRRLAEECARLQRYQRPFAILLAQLVNLDADEQLPLHASEGVVAVLGEAIRRSVRDSDVLCCLGRDRFGLILIETNAAGTAVVGDRLPEVARLAAAQVLPAGMLPAIRIGRAAAPQDGATPKDLVASASASLADVARRQQPNAHTQQPRAWVTPALH